MPQLPNLMQLPALFVFFINTDAKIVSHQSNALPNTGNKTAIDIKAFSQNRLHRNKGRQPLPDTGVKAGDHCKKAVVRGPFAINTGAQLAACNRP